MFDVDQFVVDCRTALKQDASHKFVREVVARAVSDPGVVLKALGEPQRAEMQVLHRSSDLTVLNVIWAPWMTLLPHNHQMWAVIGIYTGREDNIFGRRARQGGSRWCSGPFGKRRRAAGTRRHSLRDQPDSAPHRRTPCLWRGFL